MEWYYWVFLGLGVSSFLTVICVIYDIGFTKFFSIVFDEVVMPVYKGIKAILTFICILLVGWIIFMIQEVNDMIYLYKVRKGQPDKDMPPAPPS